MDLKEKATKGVFWSAMQSWGSKAISFLVFMVLARLLDPKAFGFLALAYVFIAFAQVFVDQGFSQALIQRKELEPEHFDTAFWISIISGCLLTVFVIAVASIMAVFFNEPRLIKLIQWLSIHLIITGFSSTPQAILMRRMAFKRLAIRSFIAAIVGGVVGISMAFTGFGVWSLVGQILTEGLVGSIILWKACQWWPGLKISIIHFKDLFSFGISMIGLGVLGFFNRRTDDFLIGYFLGPVALGYYTIAYRILLTMLELFTWTTGQVSFPIFSKLQGETKQIRHIFYTATQLTSLIAFPAFAGLAVLAPEFVLSFFGEQWLQSIPVIQVLAFIGMLRSVTYFNGTIMKAIGKPHLVLGLSILNTSVNVIGFAIAVRWGIVAVATAFVIRGYLLTPISLWILKKMIQINYSTYFQQFTVAIAGCLVMTTFLWGSKYFVNGLMNMNVSLVLYVMIGIIAYSGTILIVSPKLSRQVYDLARLLIHIKL